MPFADGDGQLGTMLFTEQTACAGVRLNNDGFPLFILFVDVFGAEGDTDPTGLAPVVENFLVVEDFFFSHSLSFFRLLD